MQVASRGRQGLQSVGADLGLCRPVTEKDGETPVGSEGEHLPVTSNRGGTRAPSPPTSGAASARTCARRGAIVEDHRVAG